MISSNDIKIEKGLKGLYVAETKLSKVDGTEGILTVKGYTIDELALHASFEEAIYLLLYDKRLDTSELPTYTQKLAHLRFLPQITVDVLTQLAKEQIGPTEALQVALSTLFVSMDSHKDAQNELIIASIPTIIAYFYRLKQHKPIVEPNLALDHAANFLYMLHGEIPEENYAKALETYLITVMDHGMNASTFTSRCIVSSGSDLLSAVLGAIGSLKGPKHGGAPGPALKLVLKLSTSNNSEQHVRSLIEQGVKIPGFGHRVYKTKDPRADVLKKAGEKFYTGSESNLTQTFLDSEQLILKLLQEYKPGRQLFTNVEFYTAYLLNGLGLEEELFTSLFASARVVGWLAHAQEQLAEDLIIRPKAYYTGDYGKKWN